MNHGHPAIVTDTDHHFIIDSTTRAITNDELKKTSLMQYDHNSERFSFEVDRIIEGHDMTLCNRVEVQYINVGSGGDKNEGVYDVLDMQVSTENPDKLVFTWLVSENATLYAGTLNFQVLFACDGENGDVWYRWHTDVNSSILISQGMSNGEAITEEYPDVLAQWKAELFARNYAYEGAVKNGFKGTEAEWYDHLLTWASTTTIWSTKQNTLGWITEEDIDAMFEGTYEGVEDDSPEAFYPSMEVVGDNLIITDGVKIEPYVVGSDE
ncbi:MAG: hypothetical protein IJY30_02165 [Muribaculaceae bacterium]|nr:hypothetical protein [Muribaculaceae bacterium]